MARHGPHLVCSWGPVAVALHTSPAVVVEPGRPVTVTVEPGRPLTLALAVADREPLVHVDADVAWSILEEDQRRWQGWSEAIAVDVPHREAVVRSVLTLRLLTYSPSGAPVAAPTTSLPEALGGARNWDYRFAWIRDASFTTQALFHLGHADDAAQFRRWMRDRGVQAGSPSNLRVLYSLRGESDTDEIVLQHLSGYRNSAPVRIDKRSAALFSAKGMVERLVEHTVKICRG